MDHKSHSTGWSGTKVKREVLTQKCIVDPSDSLNFLTSFPQQLHAHSDYKLWMALEQGLYLQQ